MKQNCIAVPTSNPQRKPIIMVVFVIQIQIEIKRLQIVDLVY